FGQGERQVRHRLGRLPGLHEGDRVQRLAARRRRQQRIHGPREEGRQRARRMQAPGEPGEARVPVARSIAELFFEARVEHVLLALAGEPEGLEVDAVLAVVSARETQELLYVLRRRSLPKRRKLG